ncbi:MAG TPA: CVNH domain-containing protein [Candidatus Limnocylindrales bacterium]|nr:CVNH domain-containing protein [Candidatus Limnocylindrales bacterium]
MNRLLLSSLVGASLAAASLAAPASAQYAPSGSYQQSCTNIRVRGNELIANCTAANGSRVRSTIDINSCRGGDIANSNGQLVCNGGSSYGNGYGNGRHRHRHRDNSYGNGGYNNGNGYGYGRGNGNNGYNNGNGYGNGNGYAPSGSSQQSCRNIRMSGGTLTASCPTGNGSYQTTSINPRSCRGGDIANRNGQLVCQ